MKNLSHSIIKTLSYSQIFSYPLTVSEIHKYLIHHKKITREELILELYRNRHFFQHDLSYTVLPGDLKLINERSRRAVFSRKKLGKALWIANIISYIPCVKLIGISGSLSMYNAKKDDDIDLFFITSKNMMWTSRLLVNIVLLLTKEKRGRKERFVKDKICPNMFITEDKLTLPKTKRNLYTAHEVAQLKVLYSKDQAYERFLHSNTWVLKYLPNAFSRTKKIKTKNKKGPSFFREIKNVLELLMFKTQHFYMKNKITNEKIGKSYAFFHPNNPEKTVKILFKLKSETYIELFEKAKKEKKITGINMLN